MQWTAANCLTLNPCKTELLWISTSRRNHRISRTLFSIGDVDIVPSTKAHLLSVLMDDSLLFVSHMNNVTQMWYFQLQKIRDPSLYINSGHDTSCPRSHSIEIGLLQQHPPGPLDSQLSQLQLVQNVSSQMIFSVRTTWLLYSGISSTGPGSQST